MQMNDGYAIHLTQYYIKYINRAIFANLQGSTLCLLGYLFLSLCIIYLSRLWLWTADWITE